MSNLNATSWYVYIIRCCDKSLYTGVTTNITRRLQEHNSQSKKTAKYLRGKQPFEIVYQLKVLNKSIALKTESAIKKLTKLEKEFIINEHKKFT